MKAPNEVFYDYKLWVAERNEQNALLIVNEFLARYEKNTFCFFAALAALKNSSDHRLVRCRTKKKSKLPNFKRSLEECKNFHTFFIVKVIKKVINDYLIHQCQFCEQAEFIRKRLRSEQLLYCKINPDDNDRKTKIYAH